MRCLSGLETRLSGIGLASRSGILLILIYSAFTGISWLYYPFPYSPWTNYLSRLGNFSYSPVGAFFYNIGCILTGVILIPFFLGLGVWSLNSRPVTTLLLMGRFLGLCSAIALILIGVFSEDQGSSHMTASSIFFLLNFFVLILISTAILFHNQFIRPIGIFGLIMTLLSLPLEIFMGGPLVEWYTVLGSLTFVGLVSYNTLLLEKELH